MSHKLHDFLNIKNIKYLLTGNMNKIFVHYIMLSAVRNQNNHNNDVTIINSCPPKKSAAHNKLINRSNKIYITNRSKQHVITTPEIRNAKNM